MAQLSVHPRLALFLLEAAGRGAAPEASSIAALLSEGRSRIDFAARTKHLSDVEALLDAPLPFPAKRLAEQLRRSLPRSAVAPSKEHAIDQALLLAYSDRVARRRGETLLMANGSSARLDRASVVESEFLLALEIEERSEHTTPLVRLAAPVEPAWLLDFFRNVWKRANAWNGIAKPSAWMKSQPWSTTSLLSMKRGVRRAVGRL
jgi:HrpA-like RNA helicase